eukprot:jgi/Botrbrau1/12207/Bobra.0197s0002.1
MGSPRRLGLLLFPGFEVLDAYGPLEMFSSLKEDWQVVSVAERAGPVASNVGIDTVAQYGLEDCPPLACLLVPGGLGTRREVTNQNLLAWLAKQAEEASFVLSVCTGAGLLAAAGVLNKKEATSNKRAWDWVIQQGPTTKWLKKARWVKDGKIWTSAGVSAGMDMALAFIQELHGHEVAAQCARIAEYSGEYLDPMNDPFG